MKKIGIITMHRIRNYGSALQAYALQSVIEKMGYECFLIDYMFPNAYHKDKVKKKWSMLKVYKGMLYRLKMAFFYKNKEQNKFFHDFQKSLFHLTQPYFSHQDLFDNPPSFDLYITGSDQVWNSKHMKGDSAFFCDFIKNGANRISYAASFSSKHLEKQYEKSYAGYLKKYAAIGVREENSVRIVNEIAQKQAVCVCDPTLLLKREDYSKLAEYSKINLEGPYILVYILGYNFNPHPMVDVLVENEIKKQGLQVVYLLCNNVEGLGKNAMKISSAGPCEFLWLFEHASFVITSSFHGTVFSLIFEKQFVSVSSKYDDRIASLLGIVHLNDRLITSLTEIKEFGDVNYEVVSEYIGNFRERSFDFLKKSINKLI